MEQTSISSNPLASEMSKGLMTRFYKLQEERVQTYKLFDEGFQAYLKSAPNYNFPLYRQLVHEIAQTFNKISQDICSIRETFLKCNKSVGLAALIKNLQEEEKVKLEMTVKLQLNEQKLIDEPQCESAKDEVNQLKQSLRENQQQLIEYMEDIKYESEDLYDSDNEDQSPIEGER